MLALVGTGLALLGLLLTAAGLLVARRSGARADIGRRLAGAREMAVGDLLDLEELPRRPVRVVGRIRCPDPIVTPRDERLVAFHRDVEVRVADGSWHSIEHVRASRGFELWDHAGSLSIDAGDAAEPLISIPYVWEGDPAELDESYAPAIDRLRAEGGAVTAARAVTRTINAVDRLLVLARVVRRPDGEVQLAPPSGGYLIAALDLPDAMRLLGGAGRRTLVIGAALATLGGGLVLVAVVLLAIALLTG
jgi:hypothetical protein